MKDKKILYISLCIVLLSGFLGVYTRFFHVPPRKAVQDFARHLIVEKDKDYLEYLSFDLISHPFMELVRNNVITDYKVLHTDWLTKESAEVHISLKVPEGEVKFPLLVVKGKNHWYISQLPEIQSYLHGIPIRKDKDDKGLYWEMEIGGHTIPAYLTGYSSLEYGSPVSFQLLDGIIIRKQPLIPLELTKVIALSNVLLEDKHMGLIEIAGDFPVYLDEGGHFHALGNHQLPIGSSSVTLYRSNEGRGRIAVIKDPSDSYDTIRVILQKTNFGHLLHPEIKITAEEAFSAESIVDGIHHAFSPGDILEIKPSGEELTLYKNGELLASSLFRWYIQTIKGGRLRVLNIERSHSKSKQGTWYRGTLDVSPYNGELALINEVSLEEYLYSVVPSEMPTKFGLEALKVQAVAARSYAVRSIQGSGYRIYGAHVDDSTASQVYNNMIEHDIALQAVQDTAGLVPFYKEKPVDARFFSTSGGYTANFHEVWSTKDQIFPAPEIPYLLARPQYPGDAPSLYNEKNFRAFINQQDLPGYDRYSSFFRWRVTFTRKQLEAVIQHNLSAIQRTQTLFVLTRGSDGNYNSVEIPENVGELQNIEVLKRGEGGNIMELEITTTHGIFKIIKEYNVRQILKPVNYQASSNPLELLCHDETIRKDFPLLPSAFAYIDFSRDIEGDIENITVQGGGYGHGVGMSQFGAYGMTLLGKTYDQILSHYYPGSELRNIYTYMP